MNTKRLRAIGKLGLLAGLPLSILAGLFSTGVYYGVSSRYHILKFEHEWLGIDVEVPEPPPEPPAQEAATEEIAAAPDEPEPTSDAPPAVAPAPAEPAASNSAGTDTPAPAEPTPAAVDDSPVEPARVEGPLAERLALPVTVRVKVLVDDELIAAHPAWIDYVQRTVSLASATYAKQFGITLELASVGRWPVATDGLDAAELLEDLEARPREGADILLGMTNRALDGTPAARPDIPDEDSPFNSAHAVIYAMPQQGNPHLRTLVHEVAHLFGARDIVDPEHPDYRSGTWMSYGTGSETNPPATSRGLWIDPENRRRVLERKDKPFRDEDGNE